MPQSQRLLKPVPKRASSPLFLGLENVLLWLRPDSDTVTTGGCRTFTASDKSCFVGTTSITTRTAGVSFWFECWVKFTSVSGFNCIFYDGGSSNGSRGFALVTIASNVLCYINGSGTYQSTNFGATGPITAGVWTHLLAVCDHASGRLIMYVNGTALATTLDISTQTGSMVGGNVFVGGMGSPSDWTFGGSIAHVRYGEGYVPTATDVTWLYNNKNPRTYADLDELGGSLFTSLKRNYECNETDPTANLIDQHDLPGDGSNDLVRTHAELLSNTGFETRTGITGANFVATDKTGLLSPAFARAAANTDPLHVSCTFRLTSLPTGSVVMPLVCQDDVGGDRIFDLYISLDGADAKVYVALIGSGVVVYRFNTVLSINTNYHVHMWWNPTDGKAYLSVNNATPTSSSSTSATISITSEEFSVGYRRYTGGSNSYFDGRVSQVQVWKRLLTEAERTSIYNSNLGKYYNELTTAEKVDCVAAWDLTDGPYSATQTAADMVGSNDLSLTAGELVTNGAMTTDASWTKGTGWTVDAGDSNTAASDGTQAADSDLEQACTLTTGRSYATSFVVTRTAGKVCVVVGGTEGTDRSTAATFTQTITVASTNNKVAIRADADFVGTVDTYSVKAASLPLASDADLFGSWSEYNGTVSAIHIDTTNVEAGAGAISCRLAVSSTGESTAVFQHGVLTAGNSYTASARAKISSGSGNIYMNMGGSLGSDLGLTTSWATKTRVGVATSNYVGLSFVTGQNVNTNIFADTYSVKAAAIAVGNGPAEAIASDSVGTNHATLTGFSAAQLISAWTTDTHNGEGYALTFDGAANYCIAPTFAGFSKTTPFSVSAWIKTTTANACILGHWNATVSPGWQLSIDGTKLGLALLNAGASAGRGQWTTAAVNDGVWKHICATYDGSNTAAGIIIYINGAAVASTNGGFDTDPGTLADVPIYIGSRQTAALPYVGQLDDVRIYNNVALTAEQVAELYLMDEDENSYGTGTGTATVTIPGLVAQWKFEDGPFGQPGEGDPLINWVSKEGDRRLLQQTTAGSRPTYHLSEVNGHPAVYFNGTSMFMSLGSAILNGVEGTVAFAVKFADPTSCTILSSADTATATKYVALGTNGSDQMQVDQDETDVNTTIRGGTTLGTDWHILFFESNGSAYFLAIDDVDETLTADSGLNNGDWWDDSTGKDNTVLGALVTSGGTSLYFEGYIADIIVYKKCLSVAERTNLYKNYLKPRYL